ncbi:MAG: HNH endonuclease [Methylococcaceae bacterium]|nr:HNH endonuclease [Methylococcaceae bacterium]
MAAELKRAEKNPSSQLNNANKKLDGLNNELKLDLAQAALDVAGIADPTPISDGLSGLMSLARGDFIGAGLSLVSMVPYAGDALAKTTKGARLTAKIAKLEKNIVSAIAATKAAKASIASKAIREARSAAAKVKLAIKRKTCTTCSIASNPFGTRLPGDGNWINGTKGNGDWMPDLSSSRTKEINKITGGKPVKFKNGYPDFSDYSEKTVKIDMRGNHGSDFTQANKAAGYNGTPKGMTWHHHQDGITMQLVPKKLHNEVPHTGGVSIVTDKGY